MPYVQLPNPPLRPARPGAAGMNFYYKLWHYGLQAIVPLVASVRVVGRANVPASGGVLMVANHLSMADIPVLMGAMPRHIHWMTKAELFDGWPMGMLMPPGEPVMVNRGKADRTALKAAEAYLNNGELVGIFAEGHRSEAAGLQAARAGSVFLAQRSNALILPVGLAGTERVFVKGFPWLRRSRIVLRIGPPFRLSELPAGHAKRPDRDQLAHELMARVAALLPPAYRGVYGD